ncbi:MAG: hypothetical protein ACI8V4_003142 [Ilumatobacter sp.]|jgi:hypothetical protein
MPGPLPQNDKRRSNAPTIPTTAVPVFGFAGAIPDALDGYNLGTLGRSGLQWNLLSQ